jgi:hypothetical protein
MAASNIGKSRQVLNLEFYSTVTARAEENLIDKI